MTKEKRAIGTPLCHVIHPERLDAGGFSTERLPGNANEIADLVPVTVNSFADTRYTAGITVRY